MIGVRSLVKPAGRDGTWRLGVVEAVEDDGRFKVRAYVAPVGAYEGTAAVYRADEIEEVPIEQAKAYLLRCRSELEQLTTLVRQTEEAIAAVGR